MSCLEHLPRGGELFITRFRTFCISFRRTPVYVESYGESVNVHHRTIGSHIVLRRSYGVLPNVRKRTMCPHPCIGINTDLTIDVRYRTIKLLRTFVPYVKRTLYIRTVYVGRTCCTMRTVREGTTRTSAYARNFVVRDVLLTYSSNVRMRTLRSSRRTRQVRAYD